MRISKSLLFPFLFFFILTFPETSFAFWQRFSTRHEEESLHERAVSSAGKGDFKIALELIETALVETDYAPEVLFDYIVILSWAGERKKALAVYENMPAPGIGWPDYLLLEIAGCYRATYNYSEAVAVYQEYLTRKPADEDAVRGLLHTLMEAGELASARQYLEDIVKENEAKRVWAEPYFAEILVLQGEMEKAEEMYRGGIEADSKNLRALEGLAGILMARKNHDDAEVFVDRVLKIDSLNIGALFWKGEILEGRRDFMAAHKVYVKILTSYPASQRALNLKYRTLMDMNANSLAREKLEESGDWIDPEVRRMLWGNEAMARIRWEQPEMALEILERNRGFAESPPHPDISPVDYPEFFLLRTDYDRILALRQKEDMEDVILEYERLIEMNFDLPYWVVEKTADAFLYLEEPKKALKLYRRSLEEQLDSYGETDPESETMMSIYHTLVELGVESGSCRYVREAGEILEDLYEQMPARLAGAGVLRDNWLKEYVVLNSCWFSLYQGRLAEGQERFEKLHLGGPFNINYRTGLANTYLWRGWPRLALEEFEIARTMAPDGGPWETGYCYVLNSNDRGGEARELAGELLEKYPDNKHVRSTIRSFAVQDMRTFTFDSTYSWEYPDVRETYNSMRLEQPVAPWRNLYVQVDRYDINRDGGSERIWRGYLGADWRRSRDWRFGGHVSADEDGGNIGVAGEAAFNPDDYLSFGLLYDSYSMDIPKQALSEGISAEEWSFYPGYRWSESLSLNGKAAYYSISDGNRRQSYNLGLDRSLFAGACWNNRLSLDGFYQTNSRNDVPYFSPESIYSVYLAADLRHTWYHRYTRRFIHNLVLGIGRQRQKDFPEANVWYALYGWDLSLSDTFSFVAGASYSYRNYDGEYQDVWGYYATIKKNF